MESLQCSLVGKPFQALLSNLSKDIFFEGKNSELISSLFSEAGVESEKMNNEIQLLKNVLLSAAKDSWTVAKLESLLGTSQLPPQSVQIFTTFWQNEHDRIRESLVKKSTWNDHFKNLSWRVDVKTDSKGQSDINESVAIFDLNTAPGFKSVFPEQSGVKFELNRAQIGEFLEKLEGIQKSLNELSS